MSYLLEALRKSQAERERQVPDLQTPAPEWSDEDPAPERSRWLVVIAAGLLLIVVLLAVLIWRLGNPVTKPAEVPVPAPAALAAPAPMPSPGANDNPVRVRAQPLPGLRTGRPAAPGDSAPAFGAINAGPAPVDRARAAPEPSPSLTNVELDAPLPSVYELPEALRLRLPPMKMNSHIYSTDPAASFVMINDAVLNPGQALGDGLTLVTITPDGAVLRIDGQKFLLPAMGRFDPPF
jgi:general secretion pathway protein B